MEEKVMAFKIIGLVIGILVFGAGIYYLVNEKDDPESKKIYSVISAAGAMVSIVCLLLLIFG